MTRFEQIYNDPNEKPHFLYDNGEFFSVLDNYPVSPGHALIIPVKPIISLFDLNDDQVPQLRNAIKETKIALESRDLAKDYERIIGQDMHPKSVAFCQEALIELLRNKVISGYNTGNNDGMSAGRTIDHLHIHLMPRYDGDTEKPEGGIRHMFPGKGYYK